MNFWKRFSRAGKSRNGKRRKATDTMAVIKSIEEKYMKEALKQAKKAYALGEVPIGCVIVHDGKIIGRGYNRRNTDKNTLAHAEITAINKASKAIGDWRLEECTLYVTLEPCQMCAGAIVQVPDAAVQKQHTQRGVQPIPARKIQIHSGSFPAVNPHYGSSFRKRQDKEGLLRWRCRR